MDKQKQIEEMVEVIAEKCEKCLIGCNECECCDESKAYCRSRCNAVVLSNAGYRKIAEGAVVLSFEDLVMRDEKIKTLCKRKTAEKFAEMADKTIAKMQGERDGYDGDKIDNKSMYDGDIVSLALFEVCKELSGLK